MARHCNKLMSLVSKGANDEALGPCRANISRLRSSIYRLRGELLLSGEYVWTNPSSGQVLGIRLSKDIIKALDVTSTPQCRLKVGECPSSPDRDMLLAGSEVQRAKYRGLYFSVTSGEDTYHIHSKRSTIAQYWERLAEFTLEWLGPQFKSARIEAAAAKETEVALRRQCPQADTLSTQSRHGILCVHYTHCQVFIPRMSTVQITLSFWLMARAIL